MKGANATRGLVLAVSCLVLGFVGGWAIANMGGKTIALPDAKVDVTVAKAAPKTTEQTDTTGEAAGGAQPARADVSVTVLNASGVAGRAAQVGTQLKGLGYTQVQTDNAAQVTGTSVYYADGAKAQATLVAGDLQVAASAPLAGSAVAAAAKGAKVVVVLGK